MKTKLKVGDSFEVVEVLSSPYFKKTLKVGGQTLKLSKINDVLVNGIDCNHVGVNEELLYQRTLCLAYKDTKPIGKLTITKVK